MALINSDVGICNLALSHLGIEEITSLDQPTTNIENICSRFYDIARYNLLRDCKFQFSIKRASLPALSEAPAFTYSEQAQLPNDFVSLLYLVRNNDLLTNNGCYFIIEGNKLLTNFKPPFNIVYIADIKNPTLFNEEFKLLLSYYLAYLISPQVGASNDKTQYVYNEYNKLLTLAKYHNGLDNPPKRITNSNYINNYYSGF